MARRALEPAGDGSHFGGSMMTGASTEEPRIRLDRLLAERGLAPSRERAQMLIRAGLVEVDGIACLRCSEPVLPGALLRVTGEALPYVGRGGMKMEAALKRFRLNVSGMRCLDVGASTGGFTDCLLQRGAASVVAIDVGHSQLAEKLRLDPRVELHEGVNARGLQPGTFGEPFDLAAVDVSFISLRLVLPPVASLLAEDGHLLALFKPEFEAGRENVGRGGRVKDPDARKSAQEKLERFVLEETGLARRGECVLPAERGKNRETMLWFRRRASGKSAGAET